MFKSSRHIKVNSTALFLLTSLALRLLAQNAATTQQPAPRVPLEANVQYSQVAKTPPMGWNSWNSFGINVTEKEVRKTAEFMNRHLKAVGWNYVVVDMGWYSTPDVDMKNFKQPRPGQYMDDFGRLIPSPEKFPSAAAGKGFKPLADYVHSQGLKFGIHILRGIPWQAVAKNTPILGTAFHACDITNPVGNCVWFHGLTAVDPGKPGTQEYYDSLAKLYASWAVDFVKVDDISNPYRTNEIAEVSQALAKCGRPIVLSLSPGATPLGCAAEVSSKANMWRMSPDFWDDWRFLRRAFDLCREWQGQAMSGHWPDCDMLPLGKLRKCGPDDYVMSEMHVTFEEVTDQPSRFSKEETYTLLSLWCIFRSPLMMGGYLPETDRFTINLLENGEAMAVNQHSLNNHEVYAHDDTVVWSADVPGSTAKYVALFNTSGDAGREVTIRWADLGLRGNCEIRDLWAKKNLGSFQENFSRLIPPHGARLLKVQPINPKPEAQSQKN